MTTAERLGQYYPFDQGVIDTVAAIADDRAERDDYKSFVGRHLNLAEASITDLKQPFLDTAPGSDQPTLMVHLAMGQPHDPNNLYQIAGIAAANPDYRLISAGNPSGLAYYAPEFSRDQRKAIKHGNFRPIVEPLLEYADAQGIESANQYGYSFGVDLAVETAGHYAFDVPKTILIEPADVITRSFREISGDFKSSEPALEAYVAKSGQEFLSARKDSIGKYPFIFGLARLSNFAITRAIAQGGFAENADAALRIKEKMNMTVAWGDESELAKHEALTEITNNLKANFGDRVGTIVLPGQKHALANDVWLQSAIVTEGLRR